MKILLRETFVHPPSTLYSYDEVNNLEDQSIVVFLAPPNLLQVFEQKQEGKDDMEENEVLPSSCANSKQSLHNAPNTPTENIGNAHGATLTEGENCVNVLFHKSCSN
jgi:hypothetical protein